MQKPPPYNLHGFPPAAPSARVHHPPIAMTPEQVVAVKFTKDGVSLFFTILRMLATRKLPRTRQSVLANIFLFLTFATDFASTAIFVYVMFEQRKIMDRHGGDMKLADAEIGREDLAEVGSTVQACVCAELTFCTTGLLRLHPALLHRALHTQRRMAGPFPLEAPSLAPR